MFSRPNRNRIIRLWVISALLSIMMMLSYVIYFSLGRGNPFDLEKVVAFIAAILGAVAILFAFLQTQKGADQQERQLFALIDDIQKNVEQTLASKYHLDERPDWVTQFPKVLRQSSHMRRVGPPTKVEKEAEKGEKTEAEIREETIEFLKGRMLAMGLRLQAPASRSEGQAALALSAGYILAGLGILLAMIRLYTSLHAPTDSFIYYLISKNQSLWPYLVAKAAPWVGGIALIEFIAVLLFKLSFQLMKFSRQLSSTYSAFNERYCGLIIVLHMGSKEDLIKAGNNLITAGRDILTEVDDLPSKESLVDLLQQLNAIIATIQQVSGGKSA